MGLMVPEQHPWRALLGVGGCCSFPSSGALHAGLRAKLPFSKADKPWGCVSCSDLIPVMLPHTSTLT